MLQWQVHCSNSARNCLKKLEKAEGWVYLDACDRCSNDSVRESKITQWWRVGRQTSGWWTPPQGRYRKVPDSLACFCLLWRAQTSENTNHTYKQTNKPKRNGERRKGKNTHTWGITWRRQSHGHIRVDRIKRQWTRTSSHNSPADQLKWPQKLGGRNGALCFFFSLFLFVWLVVFHPVIIQT